MIMIMKILIAIAIVHVQFRQHMVVHEHWEEQAWAGWLCDSDLEAFANTMDEYSRLQPSVPSNLPALAYIAIAINVDIDREEKRYTYDQILHAHAYMHAHAWNDASSKLMHSMHSICGQLNDRAVYTYVVNVIRVCIAAKQPCNALRVTVTCGQKQSGISTLWF